MPDQQEQHVGRGLFEILEQRISSATFEIIGAVYQDDATRGKRRGRLDQTLEPSHLINADVTSCASVLFQTAQFSEVGMRFGLDEPGHGMVCWNAQPFPGWRRTR